MTRTLSSSSLRLHWRHAVLVLGILLALEQARTGVNVYLQYLEIEDISIEGEGLRLISTLRERPSPEERAWFDDAFARANPLGLEYAFVGFVAQDVMMERGTSSAGLDVRAELQRGNLRFFQNRVRREGNRVILVTPTPHSIRTADGAEVFSRAHTRPPSSDAGERGRVEPDSDRFVEVDADGLVPPEALAATLSRMPFIQVIEFVPLQTNALEDRALITLVFGLLGALGILIGSAIVWTMVGKNEESEARLEEQRVLAALGKMSAQLAHELRNPLAAAMGQTELLEMLLPEGRTRDKAGEINKELERLEALSQNLLTFVNSRRVDAREAEVGGMVRDVVRLANGNPALEVDDEGAPETWRFDPITLVRAVDNVVSNALSFTPAGEVATLSLFVRDGALFIEVRDRGPGLPDGVDVFEPFVTTRITGTGLGLSISAEILRAHGGTITALNHEDGGAVFTFVLPEPP